jgi:hypothetical protein
MRGGGRGWALLLTATCVQEYRLTVTFCSPISWLWAAVLLNYSQAKNDGEFLQSRYLDACRCVPASAVLVRHGDIAVNHFNKPPSQPARRLHWLTVQQGITCNSVKSFCCGCKEMRFCITI